MLRLLSLRHVPVPPFLLSINDLLLLQLRSPFIIKDPLPSFTSLVLCSSSLFHSSSPSHELSEGELELIKS